MKDLLKQFENKRPEIVFEWKDAETDAEGWIVINSLKGGAAGGGTRMRIGLDKREVESLAKTMEVKFTVSGPAIGGAKSGINFDPKDPRKKDVLKRWYAAVVPVLKAYYGTGGDLNIDEIHEVIPITGDLGLLHPQEGVLNGHLKPSAEDKIKKVEQLRIGVSKKVTDKKYTPDTSGKYVVADLITGWGVSESVRHYYNIYGGNLKGKKVILQGWGNVAAAAGYYMAQEGALIVGIIDRNGGLINNDGYNFEEVTKLFNDKKGNELVAPNLLSCQDINEKIWQTHADIFIPAAASRLVTLAQVNNLIKNGLEVISCGANVPFADKEIFFGPIGEFVDEQISLIPDFVANCGMARVFAYLMGNDVALTDAAIFEDASKIIETAIKNIHEKNSDKTHIARTGFEIALKQLV